MAKIDSQTRIKGTEKLLKKLKTLPADVQEQIDKSFERTAKRVASRASKDVVKRTGDLSRSIDSRNVRNEKLRWGIYANFYWLWVEFGTKKAPKQPFFMTHWRKARKTVKNAIKRNIRKKLKEYGKR